LKASGTVARPVPIAFPLDRALIGAGDGLPVLRVVARSLEGMQKEAIVSRSGAGTAWRMLCDEGPYLNGTDLAPPPLAYFSAGLASDAAAQMLRAFDAPAGDLRITQRARYTMEGSALRGTMTGGALPRELSAHGDGIAAAECLAAARGALDRSIGEYLMRTAFSGTFSIIHNGRRVDTGAVAPVPGDVPPDPASLFDGVAPPPGGAGPGAAGAAEIIRKITPVADIAGGPADAGSSLQEFQKRELLLETVLAMQAGGLGQARVHLLKPTGSIFGFTTDERAAEGEAGRAPAGLDYLAAGIALCFMTQLGRYAQITRKDLAAYRLVQDIGFDPGGPAIHYLQTHVFVDSAEEHGTVRKFVDMGEQTCFLHAACRSSNPSSLHAALN